ncbi:HNH endonuclease [Peribacillus sp. NPDC097675]|uniref:HNH endonuclease n=1 Tax=Peribacillus sp. NPDC097675 TaxID=3390618 RepID=UPI003D0950E7
MDSNNFPGTQRGKAHQAMLNLLYQNLENPVEGELLFEASGRNFNYQRRLRELRSDGWIINFTNGGQSGRGWYTLHLPFPSGEKISRPSQSVRMSVLRRDNWRCQLCGENKDLFPGIVLHVDHKVPFEITKNNNADNLQVLCMDCNLGKKAQCRDCIHHDCINCELAFP